VNYIWVTTSVVLAIHDEQIAEHGGRDGVRDLAQLESALARPKNLLAYTNPGPDMADLAAAYAYGIDRAQAFFEGNKRTSSVVTETFLDLNGFEFETSDSEIVETWTALGDNRLTENELAAWIRARLTARK
jgi:death-on-curing protein